MTMSRTLTLAVALLATGIASCAKNAPQPPSTFPIRGEVVRIDLSPARVTLSHGAVPGFMDAMTMAFELKDSSVISTLRIGDSLAAILNVQGSRTWLDSVTVFRHDTTASR